MFVKKFISCADSHFHFSSVVRHRRCLNKPDSFCYICGSFTLPDQRRPMTEHTKQHYFYYFKCKVCDRLGQVLGASYCLQKLHRKPPTVVYRTKEIYAFCCSHGMERTNWRDFEVIWLIWTLFVTLSMVSTNCNCVDCFISVTIFLN